MLCGVVVMHDGVQHAGEFIKVIAIQVLCKGFSKGPIRDASDDSAGLPRVEQLHGVFQFRKEAVG